MKKKLTGNQKKKKLKKNEKNRENKTDFEKEKEI